MISNWTKNKHYSNFIKIFENFIINLFINVTFVEILQIKFLKILINFFNESYSYIYILVNKLFLNNLIFNISIKIYV